MKIFNEEIKRKPSEIVVVFKTKEARDLLDMMEAAVESNKRKSTWKKIKTDFSNKAAIY